MSPQTNGYSNGYSNGHQSAPRSGGWHQDAVNEDQLRAAAVHGQMSNDDYPVRKPMRLESLAPTSGGGRKKKRNNMMEQY